MRARIYELPIKITNREDPDQTASSAFLQATSGGNVREKKTDIQL